MHLSLPSLLLYLRATARISAVFLAGAFASSALRLLWSSPITAWMAAKRHRFTLLFALSHTFHLAGVAALASLIPGKLLSMPALLGLIAGGVGYVLIYYLAGMAFLRRKSPELPDSKITNGRLVHFVGGLHPCIRWRNAEQCLDLRSAGCDDAACLRRTNLREVGERSWLPGYGGRLKHSQG
jgi:hypothetical protein